MVDADPGQLQLRLCDLLWVVADQGERGAPRDGPAEIRAERVAELDGDGPGHVRPRERPALAQVDHPLSGLDAPSQLGRVGAGGLHQAGGLRAEAVRGAHVRVVPRVGVQAGDQLGDEGAFVALQRHVDQPLVADGGGGTGGRRGGAEAAEAVRGVDGRLVRQRLGQAPDRTVLGPGQLLGVLRADQVGAADRAVQHGSAGEHRDRVVPVLAQHEGQVARRVPRRVHDRHGQRPRSDLVMVPDGQALEADLLGCRDDVLGADLAGQREAAGHVVVVDVGFEHVRDLHVPGLRGGQDPVDVTLRVHDHSLRSVVDQVAAITEGRRLDGHDLEHPGSPCSSQSRLRVEMSKRAGAPPVSMATSSAPGTSRSAASRRRISAAPWRLASWVRPAA